MQQRVMQVPAEPDMKREPYYAYTCFNMQDQTDRNYKIPTQS